MKQELENFKQEFIEFKQNTKEQFKAIREEIDGLKEQMEDFKNVMKAVFGDLNKEIAIKLIEQKDELICEFKSQKREIEKWLKDDIIFYLNNRDKEIKLRFERLEAKMA